MVDNDTARKVLAQIDRDDIARLGFDLTDIPSPTGEEKAVSDFIVGWFKANGIKGISQEIAPGRPNAVGVIRGDGTGLSLQFNGHLDTSYVGGPEDFRILAESEAEPDEMMRASIVGDEVHGLGIGNMKCGVASIMTAGKAIAKSGVKLKGDLVLAGVVGEISRTPVNEFQGQGYRGEGVGTRHLVTHGFHTDYAVCCDGSDMNIVWAQNGVVQMKVTVYGKPEAAWGSDRSSVKVEELNAIIKMTKVIAAIERWAEGFEKRYVYQSQTGPLLPKVNVGAIQGGAPYRPNLDGHEHLQRARDPLGQDRPARLPERAARGGGEDRRDGQGSAAVRADDPRHLPPGAAPGPLIAAVGPVGARSRGDRRRGRRADRGFQRTR
jgi:acetylornithine deacetylase/succinyl-diaminopimelate desuccinylase-like protein